VSTSYPRIVITEECMREGMQIEDVSISTDHKLQLLDSLSKTGLERIVVGSFVRAEYTPQMAEIDDLLARFEPHPGVEYLGLALNRKGLERMAKYPWLTPKRASSTLMCHLCDTFIRRNANVSRAREVEQWPRRVAAAVAGGVAEAGIGVNAAFGSNFEGRFTLGQRMDILSAAHELWSDAGIAVTSIFIGDPMGWVSPQWLGEQIAAVREKWPQITTFNLHLHDSRGLALASIYEAIRLLGEADRLQLDTTAGGIGGCPYCGNGRATGMAATEDLVNMLLTMGIDVGVDLDRLVSTVWLLEKVIGRRAFGKVSAAGPHPGAGQLYDPNLPLIETMDEARHFKLGPAVAEHQIRPWRQPIPGPAGRAGGA
jgi:hydroxymethylglutaryl-CoA lyase